jgi:hypothetical protein
MMKKKIKAPKIVKKFAKRFIPKALRKRFGLSHDMEPLPARKQCSSCGKAFYAKSAADGCRCEAPTELLA